MEKVVQIFDLKQPEPLDGFLVLQSTIHGRPCVSLRIARPINMTKLLTGTRFPWPINAALGSRAHKFSEYVLDGNKLGRRSIPPPSLADETRDEYYHRPLRTAHHEW